MNNDSRRTENATNQLARKLARLVLACCFGLLAMGGSFAEAKSIAGGSWHSVMAKDDGTVWTWGENANGQLGDGATSIGARTAPGIVPELSSVVEVSAGSATSYARKSDGTVWAWGRNDDGQVGDGTTGDMLSPFQVQGLASINMISSGRSHILALDSDGSVWAWGDNLNGQVGDGTTTDRTTPCQIAGLTNIVAIYAGGYHSFAVKTDGSVFAWGSNNYGQLGDGTTIDRATPVQITALSYIAAIAAGDYHSAAIMTDGTVLTWGRNNYGQLGDGNMGVDVHTPTQVAGVSGAVSIVSGKNHLSILKSDSTVSAWGRNRDGSLGNGATNDSDVPVQSLGLTAPTAIFAGSYHMFAFETDGSVWGWGDNGDGDLGDGTTTNKLTPVMILDASGNSTPSNNPPMADGQVVSIEEDTATPITLTAYDADSDPLTYTITTYTANGTLTGAAPDLIYTPNSGYHGPDSFAFIVNDGTVDGYPEAAVVITVSSINDIPIANGQNIETNQDAAVAITLTGSDADGDALSFSVVANPVNGVLTGTAPNLTYTPNAEFIGIDVFEFVANDGTADSAPAVAAINVAGATAGTASISAGDYHNLVAKSDGTVWAWGYNWLGRLGDGTTTNRHAPVQLSGISDVQTVSAGGSHSLAIKNDGSVWAWGNNYYGQVGDGTNASKYSPVLISVLPFNTIAIAAGDVHSLAVLDDGTVWAWGNNTNGRLGDGATTNKNSPVQVQNLADVIAVAAGYDFSMALKSDGTVWAWGRNYYGQLGDGTTTDSSIPVQVLGLSGITQIASGFYHGIALKNDDTLWGWGYDMYGQMGTGSSTMRRVTPIQAAPGLSNIVTIDADYHNGTAITVDGSLYAWGYNWYGEVGDGTNVVRKSPTLVNAINSGTAVSSGRYHAVAMLDDGSYWAWGRNYYGQIGDNTTTDRWTPVAVLGLTDAPQGGNQQPFAESQGISTDEDSSIVVTLTGFDPDSDPLSFSIMVNPSNGVLTGTGPNLTYTPNADFNGADSFKFIVNDGPANSAPGTVDIVVNPVSDAPAADTQNVSVGEDAAAAITLTGSDADGDAITFSVASNPSNGVLSGTAPDLIYTPNANFYGSDSITFTVNDGTYDSAPAVIGLTVNSVNDAPVADDQNQTTDEEAPVAVTLSGSDIEGDALSFSVLIQPANGILSGTAPNLTYTPNKDFNGMDSFTFAANDGTTDSAPAVAAITVNAVGDAPVAVSRGYSTSINRPINTILEASDGDGDSLTFTLISPPANGTLAGTAPDLSYTPNFSFSGADSFTFIADDGAENSNTATININVEPAGTSNLNGLAIFEPGVQGSMTVTEQADAAAYIWANAAASAIVFSGYDQTTVDSLAAWMNARMIDGKSDVLIILDTIPADLFQGETDGSLAEEWMDNGNMLLWTGSEPFGSYVSTGGSITTGVDGADEALDVSSSGLCNGGGEQKPTTAVWDYADSDGDYDISAFASYTATSALHYDQLLIDALDSDWDHMSNWRVDEIFAEDSENRQSDNIILNNTLGGQFAQFYTAPGMNDVRKQVIAQVLNNWVALPCDTLVVPMHYSSIQAAIDAAQPRDTVMVKAGTYYEQLDLKTGNKRGIKIVSCPMNGGNDLLAGPGTADADYGIPSKKILLRAQRTILDGTGGALDQPMIDFAEGSTVGTVFDGFSVTGMPMADHTIPGHAHVVQTRGAAATVINVIAHDNGSSGLGSHAVFFDQDLPIDQRDFRYDNVKYNAHPILINNVVYRNEGTGLGNNHYSYAIMYNNEVFETISVNDHEAPGIGCQHGSHALVVGNLVYKADWVGIGGRKGGDQGIYPINRPTALVVKNNKVYDAGMNDTSGFKPSGYAFRGDHGAGIGGDDTGGFDPKTGQIQYHIIENNYVNGAKNSAIGTRSVDPDRGYVIVKNNVAIGGGRESDGSGIGLNGVNALEVIGNIVYENGNAGIGIRNGANVTLLADNESHSNVKAGIGMKESSFIGEISGNYVYGNGEVGLGLVGATVGTITDNTIVFNANPGIAVEDGSNVTLISGNLLSWNGTSGTAGMNINSGSTVVMDNNTIEFSGAVNLSIFGPDAFVSIDNGVFTNSGQMGQGPNIHVDSGAAVTVTNSLFDTTIDAPNVHVQGIGTHLAMTGSTVINSAKPGLVTDGGPTLVIRDTVFDGNGTDLTAGIQVKNADIDFDGITLTNSAHWSFIENCTGRLVNSEIFENAYDNGGQLWIKSSSLDIIGNRFHTPAGEGQPLNPGQPSDPGGYLGQLKLTDTTANIYHNVFAGKSGLAGVMFIMGPGDGINVSGASSVNVKNNVFHRLPRGIVLGTHVTSTVATNSFYIMTYDDYTIGNDRILDDPLLTVDFTLQPTSPLIDRGVVITGVNDGYAGTAPDVGAADFALPPLNHAPVAYAQSVSTDRDLAVGIVLAGHDIDGDALTFSIITEPTNGTLSGTAPNLTYTPNAGYTGADSFTFAANDGLINSAQAMASITISVPNAAPVADAQNVSVNEDNALGITLTGSDADGDALTYTVTSNPISGTLSGTAPNLTYTPSENFNGSDLLSFTVNDGHADSSAAVVSITINAVNDAPLATSKGLNVFKDTPLSITLLASDVDGDSLTYMVVANPTHGTLSGTAQNLIYTPSAGFSGADGFDFIVNDGTVDSAIADININVRSVGSSSMNDVAIFQPNAANGMTTGEQSEAAAYLSANVASSTVFSGYDQANVDALSGWMNARMLDGKSDVLIILDVVPTDLFSGEVDGALVEQWMDSGNMLLWTGSQPFGSSVDAAGVISQIGADGASNALDVKTSGLCTGGGSQEPTTAVWDYTDADGDYDISAFASYTATHALHYDQLLIDAADSGWNHMSYWRVDEIFAEDSENRQSDNIILNNTDGGQFAQFYTASGMNNERKQVIAQVLNNWIALPCNVLVVPDQYSTIQSAIDAAQPRDTVLVKAGTYYEQLDLKTGNVRGIKIVSDDSNGGNDLVAGPGTADLDYGVPSKMVLARANRTILNGTGGALDKPMIDFAEGSTVGTLFDGFNVTGMPQADHTIPGHAHVVQTRGGAATVINVIAHDNGSSGLGSHAVFFDQDLPIEQRDFRFTNVKYDAHPILINNVVYRNEGTGLGNNHYSYAIMYNNEVFETISVADHEAPGIGCQHGSKALVVGNLVYKADWVGIGGRKGGEQGAYPIDRPTALVVRNNRVYDAGMNDTSGQKPADYDFRGAHGAGIGADDSGGFDPKTGQIVYHVIEGNFVDGAKDSAIGTRSLDANLGYVKIINNEASNGGTGGLGAGIAMDGTYAVEISGNVVYSNNDAGIAMKNNAFAELISDNESYGNGRAGLGLQLGAAADEISGNYLHDNAEAGIGMTDSDVVIGDINGNSISYNANPGITLENGANAILISGNALSWNGTTGAEAKAGMAINPGSTATLYNNVIEFSGAVGLSIMGPNTVVTVNGGVIANSGQTSDGPNLNVDGAAITTVNNAVLDTTTNAPNC